MRRVWNPSIRRWRNGERGDAIGAAIEAVIVAVTVLATDLAVPSAVVVVVVDVLAPSLSLHLARLGGTRRAGAAAVVVVAAVEEEEVAISSEAMEVEGVEDAATVSFIYNKICLRLSKFIYTS